VKNSTLPHTLTSRDYFRERFFSPISASLERLDVGRGGVAYRYKRRCGIEKIFDVIKNKYHEKKAWTSSTIGKNHQAHFIALHHRRLCLFQAQVDMESVEKPRKIRAKKRLVKLGEALQKDNRTLSSCSPALFISPSTHSNLSVGLRGKPRIQLPVNQALERLRVDLAASF